jgi:uncharacterized protein
MRFLVPGPIDGARLVLDAPISFWGGVSPETGCIIDPRHPQFGVALAGKVLVLPAAKGSSSGSSVLAETLRAGLGPRAIILGVPDAILATGALVAQQLYGITCAIAVADADEFAALAQASGR